MKTSLQKLKVKEQVLDIVKYFFEILERKEEETTEEYACVGKSDEQAVDWHTKELLWEDEDKTIPKYRDKYDYVKKEELNEDDKARLEAINIIRTTLEKLV